MNKLRRWKSYSSGLPLLLFVFVGCTKQNLVKIPTYSEAKTKAEKAGPFVQEPIEKRENLPEGTAKALNKGEAAPFTGNLIDNDKARFYIAVKAERKRIRKELGAARLKAAATKIITDALVDRLKQEAKRSWWEQNKGTVAFVTGIVIGTGFVVGLTYALTRGRGAATTNFHLINKPMLVRW